ncbi:hypothetical protein, partial [Archangium sp.]|uniref:hypothetical protein n=1 Tax=Archangium sp. TaxID=1872627 RepID=UPI002D6B822B
PLRQRLAWTPCMVPFVMGFRDFQVGVVRGDEESKDPFQVMLNQHSYEEDFHWHWFLEDLQTLGFDPTLPMTDAVRYLWSDDLRVNRSIPTRLAAICSRAQPYVTFTVVESIEAISIRLFDICRKILSMGGSELKFFGETHWRAENTHTSHSMGPEMENSCKAIILSPQNRALALEYVDDMFALFIEWCDELLRFAKKFGRDFPSTVTEVAGDSRKLSHDGVLAWEQQSKVTRMHAQVEEAVKVEQSAAA